MPVEGWASDFQNLHISQQQNVQPQRSMMPQASSQGWHDQFLQSTMGSTAGSTGGYMAQPQMSMHMTNSMQQAPMTSTAQSYMVNQQHEDKLFEAAFKNIQQQIDQTDKVEVLGAREEEMVKEQEPVVQSDENAEISKIANHIVNNIDRKNEKLKSSNFMMLMQQLSEKQARLEGDKFVDQNGVDVREKQMIPQSMETTTPVVENATAGSSSSSNTTNSTSRLPDPLSLLDDSKIDKSGNKLYNPLEFAQMLSYDGAGRPHPSSWEERFDD